MRDIQQDLNPPPPELVAERNFGEQICEQILSGSVQVKELLMAKFLEPDVFPACFNTGCYVFCVVHVE